MSGNLLEQPLQAGAISLANRVVMAPLTRCRAIHDRIPNDLMAEYYRQRSGAGLILSEATAIDPMAVGYSNTPGIWNEAQIAGWQKVTHAVHAANGKIMLQLWHVGRISDPYYLDGQLPVAPSALRLEGKITRLDPPRDYVTPRALELHEIPQIVAQYARATANARHAGFDGVEIHGANGYLIDQFLHPFSNLRTDAYGGSIENHARFLLEVTDACIAAWDADHVAIHLSPRPAADNMRGIELAELYHYVATELRQRRIAFICLREPLGPIRHLPAIKQAFQGVVIANQEFTRDSAEQIIAAGEADAVAFGRLYIANPDLDRRLIHNLPLNAPQTETFYGDGPIGYTDYPFFAGT